LKNAPNPSGVLRSKGKSRPTHMKNFFFFRLVQYFIHPLCFSLNLFTSFCKTSCCFFDIRMIFLFTGLCQLKYYSILYFFGQIIKLINHISASGEPPLNASCSAFFALRNCIEEARKDAGQTGEFDFRLYLFYILFYSWSFCCLSVCNICGRLLAVTTTVQDQAHLKQVCNI
jgi:hypothetical protein